MKSHLKQNLQAYAAFALSFLGGEALSGQTVIQNFEPDLRMLNWPGVFSGDDEIDLDIDSNGIADLEFAYSEFGDNALLEVTLADAALSVYASSQLNYALPLGTGDVVGPGVSDWKTGTIKMLRAEQHISYSNSNCSTVSYGGYDFGQNSYLGFRFQLNDGIHYGWVRLKIDHLGPDICYSDEATGSPLTIFEFGYNATPGQPVVCDAGVIHEIDYRVSDKYDSEDFSEFALIYFDLPPDDFKEARYYMVPSRNEALGFTVDLALGLPLNAYFAVSKSEFNTEPGATHYERFPAYMTDIEGYPMSHDKNYVVYQLMIPVDGDPSPVISSCPYGPISCQDNRCNISPTEINIENSDPTPDGFNFLISFNEGETDTTIVSYLVGVLDYFNQDIEYIGDVINPDGYVVVPHFGVPADEAVNHSVQLLNFTKTLDGRPLIAGNYYVPAVVGNPDGNLSDLSCYQTGYSTWTLPISTVESDNGIRLIQSGNILQILIPANLPAENYLLEIHSLSGQKLFSQEISGSDNTIELPENLPAGLYIAALKNSEQYVAQLKVIIAE